MIDQTKEKGNTMQPLRFAIIIGVTSSIVALTVNILGASTENMVDTNSAQDLRADRAKEKDGGVDQVQPNVPSLPDEPEMERSLEINGDSPPVISPPVTDPEMTIPPPITDPEMVINPENLPDHPGKEPPVLPR